MSDCESKGRFAYLCLHRFFGGGQMEWTEETCVKGPAR